MLGTNPYRVIRAYGFYCVGDIIYPTGVLREILVNRGHIEPAEICRNVLVSEVPPPLTSVATGRPQCSTEDPPPIRRGRGRPRKARA